MVVLSIVVTGGYVGVAIIVGTRVCVARCASVGVGGDVTVILVLVFYADCCVGCGVCAGVYAVAVVGI